MEQLSAYVDESVHDDYGLYVIAAVLAAPSAAAVAEAALRAVPPVGVPHWHTEGDAAREQLVSVVGALDVDARVYGCRYREPRRKDSARARALGWFLLELDRPVGELVLDRREAGQDRKDNRLLARTAPARTPYRHASSASEPLLWVADIVVGAVCASWLRGADHLPALKGMLSVCEREPE